MARSYRQFTSGGFGRTFGFNTSSPVDISEGARSRPVVGHHAASSPPRQLARPVGLPVDEGHAPRLGQRTEAAPRVVVGSAWEGLHPHAFRHLVATRLDAAGLSAREIADYFGHERISMAQDVYVSRKGPRQRGGCARPLRTPKCGVNVGLILLVTRAEAATCTLVPPAGFEPAT
jgi:integrase-like protein